MMKITKKFLDSIPPHSIFAGGLVWDTPDTHIDGSHRLLRWVAVRGCILDWAVYVDKAIASFHEAAKLGEKVSLEAAQILVDCDDEAAGLYRT